MKQRNFLETGLNIMHDPYEALDGADAMALMTEWSEFHLPDFRKMAEL